MKILENGVFYEYWFINYFFLSDEVRKMFFRDKKTINVNFEEKIDQKNQNKCSNHNNIM
jgi:hypothetical protein